MPGTEAFRRSYAGRQLETQTRHSCPKWAFSILCHEGHLKAIESGGCPKAETSSSAAYAIRGLRQLLKEPWLARNRRALKSRVFGDRGDPDHRTPNGEMEVLLALWKAGAMSRG